MKNDLSFKKQPKGDTADRVNLKAQRKKALKKAQLDLTERLNAFFLNLFSDFAKGLHEQIRDSLAQKAKDGLYKKRGNKKFVSGYLYFDDTPDDFYTNIKFNVHPFLKKGSLLKYRFKDVSFSHDSATGNTRIDQLHQFIFLDGYFLKHFKNELKRYAAKDGYSFSLTLKHYSMSAFRRERQTLKIVYSLKY